MPHVPSPYAVIDYLNMDIHQGDAGLSSVYTPGARLGLKVFMDVTIHG